MWRRVVTTRHSTTQVSNAERERRIHEAIHSRKMEGMHYVLAPRARGAVQADHRARQTERTSSH